jgi:hypothetical protein
LYLHRLFFHLGSCNVDEAAATIGFASLLLQLTLWSIQVACQRRACHQLRQSLEAREMANAELLREERRSLLESTEQHLNAIVVAQRTGMLEVMQEICESARDARDHFEAGWELCARDFQRRGYTLATEKQLADRRRDYERREETPTTPKKVSFWLGENSPQHLDEAAAGEPRSDDAESSSERHHDVLATQILLSFLNSHCEARGYDELAAGIEL